MTAPMSAAVQAHSEKTGSIPVSAAHPYPIEIPAKISGKKWPPRQPRPRHAWVASTLRNPVATSTPTPMPVHASASCSVCDSPANIVNGSTVPSRPSTTPATTAFVTVRDARRRPTARTPAPHAWYSQPANAPRSATGTPQASSRGPTDTSVKRGSPSPPPNSAPHSANAPNAPPMESRYATIFLARGTSRGSSPTVRPCDSSAYPAKGAASPKRGALKTAETAAAVPTDAMARISRPAKRSRSPTHVHSPAMTPVSPASGPMLPPNSSGSSAPKNDAPMCP